MLPPSDSDVPFDSPLVSVELVSVSMLPLSSPLGISNSSPSPSIALDSNPDFEPSSFSLLIVSHISDIFIKSKSTGISFVSSATPRFIEYLLTASNMSDAWTCAILLLLITIIGEILNSSSIRSFSLLFPASSIFTL